MVITQPSLDINKFPRPIASMITDFTKTCCDSTYEQLLELRIKEIQIRSESNPSEVAIFNLNKNHVYFHILTIHTL